MNEVNKTPSVFLLNAAQAVVDRWDTSSWRDSPATGECINRLRAAIAAASAIPVWRIDLLRQALEEIVRNDPHNQTSAGIIARQALAAAPRPPAETEDQLRERFHAWARTEGFDERMLVKPKRTYSGAHLQMLWDAWRACAAPDQSTRGQSDHGAA